MPLSHKSISSITEADLLSLLELQEAEGKEIEYKRDLPGKSDTDRKEFLYDVSSFANAAGGHLIFGIAEKKGLPIELTGLPDLDPDGEIRRLEEMARDGIRPPIVGLQTTAVRLANRNIVIIIAIPKSWNPPHQVTYQKAFRFYGRDSNGKYQLDVEELRSVFNLSEDVAQRMQQFRVDRVAKIVADETPAALAAGARMVTHLMPLSAFGRAAAVDVRPLERDPSRLVHIIGGFSHTRFNADGFVAWSESSYLQMFRSGCLEAAHVFSQEWKTFSGTSSLPSVGFESLLFRHVQRGWELLESLSLRCPLALLVSFVGIKGWRMGMPPGYATSPLDVFDRDPLFIPEIVVERFEQPTVALARPLIDAIWNAAGWPGSPHYDPQGQWDPNR